MDENSLNSCLLCYNSISTILTDVMIDDQLFSIRDMLHSFSSKLDENIPDEETVLCEECAMELRTAFQFVLKVGKAEDLAQNHHESVVKQEILEQDEIVSSDFIMEDVIEKAPPPPEMILKQEEDDQSPGPSRKKSSPSGKILNVENVDHSPSRVVIFPKFVVCPTDAKMLKEDIASGRIRRDFLEFRENLKTLDITGIVISLDHTNNVDELKEEIIQEEKDDKDDMFLCRYCPKAFFSAYHLMMHTKKSHLCQFCLQGFNKVNDLHQHIEIVHDKFDCHFCPREFSSNNNLRMHLKSRHGITLPAYVSLIAVDKSPPEETADVQIVEIDQ